MAGKISRQIKRPLDVLTAALLLLAGFGFAGCQHVRPADTEGRPAVSGAHYAHLFGQRYRTKVDLYLFSFVGDPTDVKYVGRNDGRNEFLAAVLPSAVSKDNIGKTGQHLSPNGVDEIKIIDVVPAGTDLTIAAETHEVTPFSNIRFSTGYPMGFICKLNYDGKQLEGVLSEFIQSHKEVTTQVANQEIDGAIAEKINP